MSKYIPQALFLCAVLIVLLGTGCAYTIGPDDFDATGDQMTRRRGIYEGDLASVGADALEHKTWSLSGGLITGDKATTVSMQTGDMTTFGYSMMTVQFGIASPVNGNTALAQATITATVNGNPIVRVISIGQGSELSIPADALSVRVVDATPKAVAHGDKYTVTITVCPGTRASNAQPLLQDPFGLYSIPGPASTLIPVPSNSGVVGAWVAGGALSIGVAEEDSSGGTLFSFTVPDGRPFFVPVVPGVVQFNVSNAAMSPAAFSVVWVIDG